MTSLIPPQYRALIAVLTLGGALIVGAGMGAYAVSLYYTAKLETWQSDLAKSRAQAYQEARKTEWVSRQLADALQQKAEIADRLATEEKRADTAEAEAYAKRDSSTGCQLSAGWVRRDTESAFGVSSNGGDASRTEGAASGYTCADLLPLNVERNHNYRACRRRVEDLLLFLDEQRRVINAHGE